VNDYFVFWISLALLRRRFSLSAAEDVPTRSGSRLHASGFRLQRRVGICWLPDKSKTDMKIIKKWLGDVTASHAKHTKRDSRPAGTSPQNSLRGLYGSVVKNNDHGVPESMEKAQTWPRRRTTQLTDGGPSVTPELQTGVAGPPFGAAHGSPPFSLWFPMICQLCRVACGKTDS
jgi:hypothetical protein